MIKVRNAYRLTVRQLESMLRLAEALAKLHFSEGIEVGHVVEAYQLMKTSIVTIDREREEVGDIEEGTEMEGVEGLVTILFGLLLM
jgi:DNA replication licensing factor MCM6